MRWDTFLAFKRIYSEWRKAMSAQPAKIFKVWTALLSIIFAVMLFPNIIDRHGFWMSLLYTGLGVGVIWLAYFGIGQLLQWIVSKELEERNLER